MQVKFSSYHTQEVEAARESYLNTIRRALWSEGHDDNSTDDVDLLFAHGEMIALEGYTTARMVREKGQVWNPAK